MIPDDAVRAAIAAVYPGHIEPIGRRSQRTHRDVRALLEAGAPAIRAQALRDAADKFEAISGPDTDVYYWLAKNVSATLRAGADQIEKGTR